MQNLLLKKNPNKESTLLPTIKNTNYKFLRQYNGASGIKTGYTNAAGHNLAASAKRDEKQLIGIIIGTSSSSERAKKMIGLFDDAFKAIPKRKKIIDRIK